MTEAAGPGDAFAIGDDTQYQPVAATGDLRVPVSGPEGTGLLACHASDALIVAPQFLADVDRAGVDRAGVDGPDGALYWRVEGWKGGYPAVVVFGNSAGGQFVNRYAAVGRGPDVLAARGLRVRFVVANPSTYLYFSRERPVAVPDAAHVNDWRYGFDRAPGYVDADPGRSLERYLGRDITIVLGELDNDEASLLLEVSPAAMAQGANRLDRGLRYDQHVRALARAAGLPFRHRMIRLAGVGHTAADVLAAERTREIVFAGRRGQPRA